MPAKRSEADKLYVQIANAIRFLIEDGAFRPGDKLPPLAHLAEQFQCSRATVREALGALRGQGLVELRHGDGTYVRNAAVEMWMEPLDAAILLASNQVQQLLELMIAILAGIASVASEPGRITDFGPIAKALFDAECAQGQGEEEIAAELGFYSAMVTCANNPLLENALRVLQESLRSSIRILISGESRLSASEVRSTASQGIATCRAVFDAVRTENQAGARDAVYRYGDVMRDRVGQMRQHLTARTSAVLAPEQ